MKKVEKRSSKQLNEYNSCNMGNFERKKVSIWKILGYVLMFFGVALVIVSHIFSPWDTYCFVPKSLERTLYIALFVIGGLIFFVGSGFRFILHRDGEIT